MTKLEARLIRSDMGLLQDLETKVKEFKTFLNNARHKCNSYTAQEVIDLYAESLPHIGDLNDALDMACAD